MKNFTKFYFLLFFTFLFFSSNSLLAQCSSGQTYDTYCYDQGETNNVAFEFCPTSGDIAQSTIIAGAIGGIAPINTLTVYEGTSGSGIGGTVVFGPASSSDFAGTVITASATNLCLIFVINSMSVSITCEDGFDTALEVCSESIAGTTVVFTAPADLCINAGAQAGLGGGTPTGGVYSGTGVTDNGNGTTYSFDPAAAGVGTHTLTYTNGGAATDDVEVFALPTTTFTALTDLCIDAGTQTGLGSGSPSGGVYSGPGVTDDGNGSTYTFDPAAADLGVHTITYTEPSTCMSSTSDMVEVLAACGCPAPQTSNFHCSAASENDLIIFEICPTSGEFPQATINQGTYNLAGNNLTIYQGTSGSGIGGTILYGPQTGNLTGAVITGTVADQCLIFVSNTIAGGCQNGFETALIVCGESLTDPILFTAPGDLCIDDGVQTGLSGGTPVGGVYSGSGVTDNGNGMTFSFDPAAAGVGVHTLTYNLGGSLVSDDVEVFTIPVVTFTTIPDLCIDAGNQNSLGGGSPTGGVYSGSGVTDDGNGLTYSFNPLTAGIGVHTITYTEGGVCMELATDDIEVTAACSCPSGETTYFNCYDNNETNLVIFEVCPNAGEFAQADINQGTFSPDDALTVYQGASGSGTGGTIVYGPTNGNLAGNTNISTIADECLIFVINSGPAASCADGFEIPLIVCGSSLTSNVTFTALADLSVNAGVQTGLSDGSPTGGVYSGPGVTDDGNGMTYTFNPAVAGVGVHTLTYTIGGNSDDDDVEVLNLLPPSFSKSFNTNEIGPGSVSTLTFTINNTSSGTGVTDLAFIDNLPAGVTIASPPIITSSCTDAIIIAPAGGSSISVSDGTIDASSFCTISVNVTSSTAGTHTNTTGDLTSSSGNSGTASANLTVAADRPGFSKSFTPASVNLGERSTLTFTIDNTANGSNHSNLTFTDNLPTGMVVANPSNAIVSCGGGAITAVPGSSAISYTGTIFTDASVAAGSTCTISVDVLGQAVGQLNNVTGNLTSYNNFFQILNSGKASASLEVLTPSDIHIQKSFSTNPATPGGLTDLVFTITNFNRDFPATNISFTDDLTTVLAGLTAVGTPINNTCGTGSSLSGTTMLTFTGGTIPADGSCTFNVPLLLPVGAALGTYTNVTSAITADINGSTITGNQATEDLYVANIPTFTKTFLDDPIPAGGITTLEFTITNTSTTSALTDISFTDDITNFISGATISSLPAAGSCGAGSTFFTTTSTDNLIFNMSGGNIAADASCTFTVDLTIPTNTGAGAYTNTTSYLSGTVDGNSVNGTPATDDLTVLAVPRLSKSFTNDPVNPGDIVNLEFTITYDEFATGDATDISFTDDLNAVIPGLAAVGLPLNDICGTGASISGTTNLTFSGGILSPGGTCTFSVPVQVPAGIVPGSYTNTTSAITSTVGGQSATGNTATDDLDIGGFSLTKEFLDNPVFPGQLTTLRFTLDNTSAFDATNVVFTDNLSSVLSGLLTEAPLPVSPCGGTFFASGNSFIILTGGSVSAGTSCTFDVPVRVPASATSGTYNNVTSNLTATIDGANRVLDPAVAPLIVENNLISLTKTFTDDPVTPGGTVTVEYTLTNLNATNALSNIAFTDDFDAALTGLAATGLPASVCGGTVSGTGLLSFSGGSLAAGASCTFSVTLQTPASTPYGTVVNCSTSGVTGEVGGFPVIGDAADDDLQFQSFLLTKSIAGPVAPGETTTLTFTITNFDPVNTIDDVAFSDDLDAFISGMTPITIPPNGSCGPISEVTVTGTSVINFGRGSLAGGQSCSFDVTVQVPCGTAVNTYTNTTSTVTAITNGNNIISPAATNTLVVSISSSAAFTAPSDLCLDAGMQTGLGGGTPTGGVYSGTGVTDDANGMTYSFDPAAVGVGTHTLTYTFTNANGCTSSASDDIVVNALPVVTFTALTDLCLNAGVQNDLGGGTPTGGVYSGTGVTDDGNGMTYDFDPAMAGVGTHSLTYTFTDANGCTDSASDDVQVFAIPNAMFTAPADLCLNAGGQAGLGGGTPTGGVYSGSGITDDGNGMTYSFDPAAAGVGTHSITYAVSASGCTDSASDDVEVFALPIVTMTISALEDEYCVNDPTTAISLAGAPTGGVYSGTGVTDLTTGINFTFDPATAGVGTHTVTYTFTDANGCTGTATDDITVNALPTVTFIAPADLCLNAGVQNNLGGGTPTGGVYSGVGINDDGNGMTYDFDPAMAGVGSHTLTYTFTDANGCTNSASDDVQVFAIPNAMFTAPADLCLNAGVQAGLGGGTPIGGVYSGVGVTDDGNGTTYSFDPAAAGVGSHNITYAVGVSGCTDSASDDVEVFALPTVMLNTLTDQCINAGVQNGMAGGTPTGGIYSGPGVTDNGNGMSFSFDPATAGVGTHSLSYTFTNTNGCTNSASDDVEVFALPVVMFTASADLCLNAGVQNDLGGGTPTGGVYSGVGVTDDGSGITYDFDPAIAGVGTHTLTYTFTDANGCTNSATDDVEVFPLPIVTFTALADLCENVGVQTGLGGGLPTGGVYSGTGVNDGGNGMTYTFDPATAGTGTHTITYTVGVAGCSDSANDDVEVFATPSVTLTIPSTQDEFCLDDPVEAISLAGSPTGGVYSGAGVTDLATGINFTFNPAIAGVGSHTVTYTFTNTNGCTSSATDNIVVNALPIVTFTAPADLCLNAGVQNNLGGGTPTGGVYSGAGVNDDANGMTYDFDPATAGVGSHTLTYTFTDANGCTNSASDDVQVFALPTVSFTALADLCENVGVQNGLGGGLPTGGVYSGTGVNDGGNGMTYTFDPAAAGVGTHTITYTVSVAGCSDSANDDVEVFATPSVTLTIPAAQDEFCLDDPVEAISLAGSPTGGVYSGAGVTNLATGINFTFNPAIAGVGSHTVTYTFTNTNGCTSSATDNIVVNALPIVTFTAPADLCLNAGVQNNLGGGTPTGGIYSGTGVTDDGNGMTYDFDPATAGVGTHTLTYTFTDANGCTNSASDDVDIFSLPTVAFTALADICVNAGVQTGLGDGLPTGGVYSGTGVTDDGNGMTYTFDPAAAGVGTHSLTYTFTDTNGCSGNASDDVEVSNSVSVSFTALADLCENAGIQTGLSGGLPTANMAIGEMGIYNGTGVTDDGNGMTYSFDPATAGVGTHSITYSYTSAQGCSGNASDDVEVIAIPASTFTVSNINGCEGNGTCIGTSTVISPQGTGTNLFKFYDADPNAGGAILLDGPVVSYDPMTTAATSPQSIWVVECLPGVCDSEAEEVVVTIVTNPIPLITIPSFPTSLSCEMAGSYSPMTATFTNGLTGACENAGSGIIGTVTPNFTACGGSVSVTYSGFDNCGNTISAGPYIINVDPAPVPTVTTPILPTTLSCGEVLNFDPDDATYTNSLTGGCLISGTIEPQIQDNYNICDGGTITVTYSEMDDCSNLVSAPPITIIVTAAPSVVITIPTFPASLNCETATTYSAPNLTFDNGVATGLCSNVGSITATVNNSATTCMGGTVTISYSGQDNCGNTISEGPFMIPVDPPPAATLNVLSLPTTLTCVMAETYVVPNATYENGLSGNCENSGSISATVVNNSTACGGSILISYNGEDNCGNALSAGPFTINVEPAPLPILTTPSLPLSISCSTADGYTPPIASYTNNLNGTCNLSGTITASIVNFWDACGGYLTVTYSGEDECGRSISAVPITVNVLAAPIPTITVPVLPNSVSCEDGQTYLPPNASFSNGLSGACNISGSVSANVNYFFDACGGTLEIIYSGTEDCGRNLVAVIATITVEPAPAPTLNIPNYPTELTCNEAESLDGILAPYDNGLVGDCEISGLLEAELIKDVTAGSGGTVTVVYSGTDNCGNILSAPSIIIPVLPAPIPTIQLPNDPSSIYCWDADIFTPGIATFSNNEPGFCENSGEVPLTTFEHYWSSCDGGYILLQYSGFDNAGNFLESDLFKIPVLPDTWAPQGVCIDLNITLDDIKDTPAPNELTDYQNQIASSYFENCGSVNVILVSDSGSPVCGLDGIFERVYEFEVTDDCGNVAGICSVTFSGNCNPLYCTLTQDFYSSPTESFAGLSSLEMIDLLIGSGANPIVIGTQECGFTVDDASCIQAGLSGQGPSISLPNDFQLNCGDQISNTLVNQLITTNLNISYNAILNNGGIDYGNFQLDAACMYIPQSISTGLPDSATVNDLIDYANNFIGCQCSNTCGQYDNVMAELSGIFSGLSSRFNKCHVPGPCFLDGTQSPNIGVTFETDPEESNSGDTGTTSNEEVLENKDSQLEVILFPNPADEVINIKLNNGFGKSCLLEVFDARGIKLGEKYYNSLEENILTFDIQKYETGIYWMTIKLDDLDQVIERFMIVDFNK